MAERRVGGRHVARALLAYRKCCGEQRSVTLGRRSIGERLDRGAMVRPPRASDRLDVEDPACELGVRGGQIAEELRPDELPEVALRDLPTEERPSERDAFLARGVAGLRSCAVLGLLARRL